MVAEGIRKAQSLKAAELAQYNKKGKTNLKKVLAHARTRRAVKKDRPQPSLLQLSEALMSL